MEFQGEIYSIITALCWSVGVILFRMSGFTIPAISLNLFKNALAVLLLTLTMIFAGTHFWGHTSNWDLFILIVSGIIGIAIADTLFFVSLNILGASLSAIIDCLYSPFTVLFAHLFIGERILFYDYIGGAMIISAIFLVTKASEAQGIEKKQLIKGISIGALSMSLMAIGIVMAKPILNKTPVLWSSTMRLLGGLIALALYTSILPSRKKIWSVFKPQKNWKVSVPASLIGAYIAMMLWIAGMKYTDASVAAILNQLSTIFIVILAFIFLKEKATPRKIIAVIIAFAGAMIVVFI